MIEDDKTEKKWGSDGKRTAGQSRTHGIIGGAAERLLTAKRDTCGGMDPAFGVDDDSFDPFKSPYECEPFGRPHHEKGG